MSVTQMRRPNAPATRSVPEWAGQLALKPVPPATGNPRQHAALRPLSSPARATRRRPRAFFAFVTAGVMFGVMIAQMLLSVALESGAYEISHLQTANKEATRTYQQVSQELAELASPQHLALNAEALGMLSNNTPSYLRLSDGAILGAPTSGDGFTNLVAPDGGTFVPNSLLADVPLVTSVPASPPTSNGSASTATALGAPAPAVPAGPVPLSNGLPGLATR